MTIQKQKTPDCGHECISSSSSNIIILPDDSMSMARIELAADCLFGGRIMFLLKSVVATCCVRITSSCWFGWELDVGSAEVTTSGGR